MSPGEVLEWLSEHSWAGLSFHRILFLPEKKMTLRETIVFPTDVSGGHFFSVLLFFFYFIFILDTITDVLIFPPYPPPPALVPHPPTLFSSHCHAVVCVSGLCVYVLWLIPSPSFVGMNEVNLPTESFCCQWQTVSFLVKMRFLKISVCHCESDRFMILKDLLKWVWWWH